MIVIRILIVENEEETREVLERAFKSASGRLLGGGVVVQFAVTGGIRDSG